MKEKQQRQIKMKESKRIQEKNKNMYCENKINRC